jgi:hypothetical protein
MTNDQAREILYHARLHLVRWELGDLFTGDTQAIQTLARIEMGLAYNVSMPGRGI